MFQPFCTSYALKKSVFEQVDNGGNNEAKFKVLDITPLGEVDKNKTTLSLNFTSFIRSSSLGSLEIDTPSRDDDDDSGINKSVSE